MTASNLPQRKIVLPHVFGLQKQFQNLCPQRFVPKGLFLKILFPKILSPLNFNGILEPRFFSYNLSVKKLPLNFAPVSHSKIDTNFEFSMFTTRLLSFKVLAQKSFSKVCSSIFYPQSQDLKMFFPRPLSPSKIFVSLDSESKYF